MFILHRHAIYPSYKHRQSSSQNVLSLSIDVEVFIYEFCREHINPIQVDPLTSMLLYVAFRGLCSRHKNLWLKRKIIKIHLHVFKTFLW